MTRKLRLKDEEFFLKDKMKNTFANGKERFKILCKESSMSGRILRFSYINFQKRRILS